MTGRDDIVGRLRAAGCVFAEDEAVLLVGGAATGDELEARVARRVVGEPLELVLGWVEFAGQRLAVAPGVFLPRPRTEALAAEAARLAQAAGLAPVVVDLCCGVGAIAAAVAHALPAAAVHAADVDPAATDVARRNLASLGVPADHVTTGDLFHALPADLRGRVDVLAANVPYVPTADIATLPPEHREHEPLATLDGGADGLDVARRVLGGAAAWLAPGGSVLFECASHQLPAARTAVSAAGLVPRVVTDNDLDATVVVATRPSG